MNDLSNNIIDDIFNYNDYDEELVRESCRSSSNRFKNECLIHLGEKEPRTSSNWCKKTEIKSTIIDIISKNNPIIKHTMFTSDTVVFLIKISDTKISYPIQISMTECYPFKPPKVRINYIDFFDNLPHALYGTKYFKEVFKQECLCCSSILCSNNWGPNFGFITILNEIYNIIQKISICKDLYYCDKIIDKYFGHFIPIKQFLF